MAEPDPNQTFTVDIVDTYGQLRMELRYRGDDLPPWWRTQANRSVIDAAIKKIKSISGVTHVHEGLTTSITLRLFVEVDQAADCDQVKQALTSALLGIVQG